MADTVLAVAFNRCRQEVFANGEIRENLPPLRHQTNTALGHLV